MRALLRVGLLLFMLVAAFGQSMAAAMMPYQMPVSNSVMSCHDEDMASDSQAACECCPALCSASFLPHTKLLHTSRAYVAIAEFKHGGASIAKARPEQPPKIA